MRNNDKLLTMQDKELVTHLKKGSHQAFEELYARNKGKLMYFCKLLLKDETAAEDIIHDIFLQIWETRDSLNAELSFSGYLHTLAQNRILNMFRQFDIHSRFAQHILMNEKDSTNQTEDSVIDNDYKRILNKQIDSLSPRQKEIFRLSRIQKLTYKEISKLLQISVDTVQEHASLALKKIKEQLKKDRIIE